MQVYWGLHPLSYNEKIDIVCIGKTNLDIFYYYNKFHINNNNISKNFVISPGGKATNVAVNLAKLDLKVRLISCIGNDIFGNYVKTHLEKILYFTPKIVNTTTAVTSIVVDKMGNNTMFHNIGANKLLSEDYIPEKIEISFIQTGIPKKVLTTALKNSKVAFVELSEPAQFNDVKNFKPEIISLNLQEIERLFEGSLNKKIDKLLNYTNKLLLKMGKDGILYATRKKIIKKEAKKVKVINTTGAGDAVSAAFLYGYIKMWNIERILDFSLEFAAKKIQSPISTI